MFDFPLPPAPFGLYEQLGLSPEATAEEINEARQELASELQSEKRQVDKQLDEVYQHVDGLREVYGKLGGENSENDPRAFRAMQSQVAQLEDRACQFNSEYSLLREQAADLERRIHETNLIKLQNPQERLVYDQSHPPLELLKLADCGSGPFDDRKVVVALIRAELSEFFEQAGEAVYHPSDLTREDFTDDFTHDPLLDRQQ
jgi:predicted  nucleic acid-binding Zn-ribbon protein